MDGLLQPRIGGLYHGVSRQAYLQRSPSQMQELENFLPSVDYAGFVDRPGTRLVGALQGANYATSGHHFFRTTDGQRWVVLRRAEAGSIEVWNVESGIQASLTVGPYVQSYIGSTTEGLRYLSLSDTTLILNTEVTVGSTVTAVTDLTAVYLVVRKTSTAAQIYRVTSEVGTASVTVASNTSIGRDSIALQLATGITSSLPGATATLVAPNVIKVTASASILSSIVFANNWDEEAAYTIKGRVTATSDLPATFETGVPILVDLGSGSTKSSYYVRYDSAKNAWIECSYAPNGATTGSLTASTLPIRLHQTATNAFELQPCAWVARETGDDDSNPFPDFVGYKLTALANWKGRLWLAADDTVYSSQADDLFNFFRQSAREVLPADPVTLPIETQDVAKVAWMVGFRSKLMVLCDNAQLEIPGDDAVTPTDAVIGVVTKYQLDTVCPPRVLGDSLYYTGPSSGRSALWEYQYDQQTANNTAEDLSKHVPGYLSGKVRRIEGAAQSGRVYLWDQSEPGKLFVQTSYWKDGQRAQNAWSSMSFPGVERILTYWVHEDTLYLLATSGGLLKVLTMLAEAGLGGDLDADKRLDHAVAVEVAWNTARQRSEVILPTAFAAFAEVVILVNQGDGWWREYTGTVVTDGSQWLAHFPYQLAQTTGYAGLRYTRTATFSPFYPTVDEKTTPLGRLQVARVTVDCMVSCDYTATVTRPDRVDMVTGVSPRLVNSVPVPEIAHDVSLSVPFNSRGDAASLTVTTTSTGPLCITGLTLQARYTNPRR
ncbi:phage nozzle protein [Xylophilus sp.]|uniref:phage nozzle protein n=1 Tax=Xylophilus sp. TaxID=2653893 RepID=UPI0013BA5204|nr:hypothetical protein [Xylophilus sp.]KAF1049330.1 MAG: hypothetical protein GAK38_00786 [Xylophilus sp.]